MQQGQIVEFEIGPGPKGPQARRVRVLAENNAGTESQLDNKTSVPSILAHIDGGSESSGLHQDGDVQNRNKLITVIGNFFLFEYRAQLGEQDKNALAMILDSCGVRSESLNFAISVGGGSVSTPDQGFNAEDVFHLWSTIQPVMANNKKKQYFSSRL